ncbi:hypothetical protein ACA910_012164 [Epithemia clementina (nom. ined.)]
MAETTATNAAAIDEHNVATAAAVAAVTAVELPTQQSSIILFYKYHPLSNDFTVMERYRSALEGHCHSLELKGRILVGCSKTEGINGTLAGRHDHVQAFTWALLHDSERVQALKQQQQSISQNQNRDHYLWMMHDAIDTFWTLSKAFFEEIQEAELIFDQPSDFKWSHYYEEADPQQEQEQQQLDLFPDLNIKLTKELIGSGGVMLEIPVEETAQGYLTPSEWHEELTKVLAKSTTSTSPSADAAGQTSQNDEAVVDETTNTSTVLIDCRNTKEYDIGHFPGALDPRTTNYSQFSHWVNQNQALLQGKKVLMYCTGGIRCEKASAYIRRQVPSVQQVKHLKGGIHKYLEEYGRDGLWQGKNFVFDARQASSAEETRLGKQGIAVLPLSSSSLTTNECLPEKSDHVALPSPVGCDGSEDVVVGKCLYCQAPYDTFGAHCVCAVCRELVLICTTCQTQRQEYHCRQHFHLKDCYFLNLAAFSVAQLRQQWAQLQAERQRLAVGRRFKQKRQTLARQCVRVENQIKEKETKESDRATTNNNNNSDGESSFVEDSMAVTRTCCRSCGDAKCEGKCWGFYGLKRKELLEQKDGSAATTTTQEILIGNKDAASTVSCLSTASPPRPLMKRPRRGLGANEIHELHYHQPPSSFQHNQSIGSGGSFVSIRCPPCVTRIVQSFVKAKWCGQSVMTVLTREFAEFSLSSSCDDDGTATNNANNGDCGPQQRSLQASLTNGLIKVNHVSVTPVEASHVKLKSGDLLGRVLHWHEPPVVTPWHIPVQKVPLPQIVAEEHGLTSSEAFVFVCDKPSSVPVHPAGPYLANTLTIMIEAQEDLESRSLKPIHRTDRATSGLTLLSTSSMVAKIFHQSLSESSVEKLYLANVCGRFPSSSEQLAQFTSDDLCQIYWNDSASTIEVTAPIFTPDPMSGVRIISDQGKPSRSIFKFLRYDSDEDSSIVACYPVTGRNHQIRVHLRALKCPILGDVQYGGRKDEKGAVPIGAVQEIMQRCADQSSSSSPENRLPGIDEKDIDAARKICPNCYHNNSSRYSKQEQLDDNGWHNFTKAQILQGGHKIYLHALRYRVSLHRRKNKKKTQTQCGAEAFVAEYSVDAPEWASSMDPSLLADDLELWTNL